MRGFDYKRIVQAVVLVLVLGVFYALVNSIFADSMPKHEITSHGVVAKKFVAPVPMWQRE